MFVFMEYWRNRSLNCYRHTCFLSDKVARFQTSSLETGSTKTAEELHNVNFYYSS